MKAKLALLALAAPSVFAALVVFHPGVAFAETPLAQQDPSALPAGTYTLDPNHASVGFDIGHLGLSRIQGRFTKLAGKFVVDPKALDKSSVTFNVTADSVDTSVAPRDAHLKSKDFFEVEKYPEITFVSTKIAKKGKGYVATGNLTMHGVTQEIKIPFQAFAAVAGPQGTKFGIVSEPIRLSRKAYGVGDPKFATSISDDVNVRLSLEAAQDK